jgi:hypothetical protein
LSDRLLRVLNALRWNLVIRWRAAPGRWFIFRDAPDEVVSRWAESDLDKLDHSPILQQTVIQAQGELELRALQSRCGAGACTTKANTTKASRTKVNTPKPSIATAQPSPHAPSPRPDEAAPGGPSSPAPVRTIPSART